MLKVMGNNALKTIFFILDNCITYNTNTRIFYLILPLLSNPGLRSAFIQPSLILCPAFAQISLIP
jgi:hypothetical protein